MSGAEGDRLATAFRYAARGWPVFPCQWQGPKRKKPLTDHGYTDATTDLPTITGWWRRWPAALIGTPTGHNFVVLDVDPQHGGYETLAALGWTTLPATPTTVSGSGGRHLYFTSPPKGEIRNTQGAYGRGIGTGLDWRGKGGYVIVPAPGTGYEWVPETRWLPLAPVPPELLPRAAAGSGVVGTAARCEVLTPYGEAALWSAAAKILAAPNGEQEAALNGQAYSIGRLAGAGGVPAKLALDVLMTAARGIPDYDRARPWRAGAAEAKVAASFAQGLAKPRPTLAELDAAMDAALAEATDDFDWEAIYVGA